MPDLTDAELQAITYYVIGVGSEGGDVAYRLSFAGTTRRESDGSAMLEPIANSGYTIGVMQTDLGQAKDPPVAKELVESFQVWAGAHQPDWVLPDVQAKQLAVDLARDGHHIRDPDYDKHVAEFSRAHHVLRSSYPDSRLPKSGIDIDPALKEHVNTFLATDAGKVFVHKWDVRQAEVLRRKIGAPLQQTPLFKESSRNDQVRLFAMVAKIENQSPKKAGRLLEELNENKLPSLSAVEAEIGTFVRRDSRYPDRPTYMETGRDAALKAAELYNTLHHTDPGHPLHAPWQAVASNPLVGPTQALQVAGQPDLGTQHDTIKTLFAQPVQGRSLVDAMSQLAPYAYGDPARRGSRGLYTDGQNFLVWDRTGQGHAFVGGQWSSFPREELTLSRTADHARNLTLARDGQAHLLLHVDPPGRHASRAAPAQTEQAPNTEFGNGTYWKGSQRLHDEWHRLANPPPLPNGPFGPITQAPSDDAPRDCSDPAHPQYAMYRTLKELLPPGTSEERLMPGTAACHCAGIKDPSRLAAIDIGDTAVRFSSNVPGTWPATMDIIQPAPTVQQSMQQVEQHDQQLAQVHAQFQAQQTQTNAQAQQGPVMGGPVA